jgi:UDP-glucuronate 4-epimerase
MHVLVSGTAGFIGMFVTLQLLERGDTVTGLDNLNAHYDPAIKHARLERLRAFRRFTFAKMNVADGHAVHRAFADHRSDRVIHLAAQAGVRHSLTHPNDYVQSNLVGTANMLEACRHAAVEHLVYASTSSVYGLNRTMPLSPRDPADHAVQFHAATKRATELMAHS